MLIGILQAGHINRGDVEFPEYDALYPAMLDGHGFDFKTWRVVDGEFPQSPDEADGWLISGSRHGAYEDHPWIPPLENFVRDAYVQDVPLVGICFGHQIMAQALGGRVEKFAGGWAVGLTEYRIEDRSYALNAWHQDQVVEVPPDATVIGESDFCENAALAYKGKAFSVQPHPEFDADVIAKMLEYRAPGLVPDDRIAAAGASITRPDDNRGMAARIARFFKDSANG